jgi:holliday junction DNA helicase RuvA
MIARLTGVLASKMPPHVLVDVGGVGYDVQVPMSTFYNLPDTHARVTLLTQFIVREDAQLLYGFLTEAEREDFRALIKISGVGPRIALAVLSGLSSNDLAQAVASQDVTRLIKVPGIGKKTAERLLLELKGKLAPALPVMGGTFSDHHADIQQALMALGYADKEAQAAVRQLPAQIGVSDGIKQALKALS